MQYKKGKPRNLQKIANQPVAHLLEGSAAPGNRVRVNARS
jgi:TolB-like protein